MKSIILAGLARVALRSAVVITALGVGSVLAQPVVKTLGGGASKTHIGYVDNTNTLFAIFDTPMGLAVSQDGGTIFVADRDNNAVRLLTDFQDPNNGFTFTLTTNFLSKPVGVGLDAAGDVYVLNRGSTSAVATNGTVLEFDTYGFFVQTNAAHLTNAAGIALDPYGNIYVTERSNLLVEIYASNGVMSTVASIPNAGASLQGIAIMPNGSLAVCDSGLNGIYDITPNPTNAANTLITTNAGFLGQGDGTGINNEGLPTWAAKFFQPSGVACAGDGSLIVSDYGNGRVKVITASGIVTNLYGVSSNDWKSAFPGWVDGTVQVPDEPGGVAGRCPYGVALAPDGSAVYTTEDFYSLVRKTTGQSFKPPVQPIPATPGGLTATLVTNEETVEVLLTWDTTLNTTNYVLSRGTSHSGPFSAIDNTTGSSFTDGNVAPGGTYYYVVQAQNNGGSSPDSASVSIEIPTQPPAAPVIGWYDFEGNTLTGFYSTIHSVTAGNPFIANNPLLLAVDPATNGLQTYYLTIPPNTNDTDSGYVITNGAAPPVYENNQLFGSTEVNPLPTLPTSNGLVTIEAVSVNTAGPSAVTSASFLFQVGPISLNGTNAAQFTLSDVTTNMTYLYTVDGSNPLTNANAFQVITASNVTPFSIDINTTFVFQAVAEAPGFAPSPILSYTFLAQNFQVTTLTWGFQSGYCSSEFVGSPGETFYAPVTINALPGTTMYGLEFNMVVTNLGPDAVAPGAFGFVPYLMAPGTASNVVGTVLTPIPPLMFIGDASSPPPANQIVQFNGTNFVNLEVPITNLNELALGWFEVYQHTNLFNTLSQNLLSFSEAFIEEIPNQQFPNKDIVGGYSFLVPTNAQPGEQYQIQLNRASANGDGFGGPNSAVPIELPLNGSLGAGAVNAIKIVTVAQPKYMAGDVYPFNWFNAGDFGYGDLTNYGANDVEATFDAAVYGFNQPPVGSDFFDAMDSSGGYGVPDNASGYWTNANLTANSAAQNALFNLNNDTTINQMAFGDGMLDVCDVYVTFARSQDPSLYWFQRFYTNDPIHGVFGRVAMPISPQTNVDGNAVLFESKATIKTAVKTGNQAVSITNTPTVHFAAGDYLASAGQTVSIPITATVFGSNPARMFLLNAAVVPLDGSPAPTVPPSFTLNPPFSNSAIYNTSTADNSYENYAVALLPAVFPIPTNAAVTGSNVIGYLNVVIPASATSMSAYAVHFNHASASPNGLVSFPKTTYTGLITLSSRTSSYYNDGIPDSWRLRYFGTIYNELSVSNADADGTGMDNWQKYQAGLNPVDPTSVLNAGTDQPMAQSSQDLVLYWPTVNGQTYVIQRSPSLFPPKWTSISTNIGDGTYMEIHDTSGGNNRYYQVTTP